MFSTNLVNDVKKKKYYNVDYELLVVAFFEFLKSQGLDDLELTKAKVLFAKDNDDNLKNNLFFVHILSYFDLVMPPKGSYFSYNSIGLSELRIGYYIGKEMIDEHIEVMANNKLISSVALGQKNVNIYLKENQISERSVLKSEEFLG